MLEPHVCLRFTIQPDYQTIVPTPQPPCTLLPKNQNLPFCLHLALFACTKLIISTLRSVGSPTHYLHSACTKLHTACTKKPVPCTQRHNHATRSCQYRERVKPIGATAAPVPLCRHTPCHDTQHPLPAHACVTPSADTCNTQCRQVQVPVQAECKYTYTTQSADYQLSAGKKCKMQAKQPKSAVREITPFRSLHKHPKLHTALSNIKH